MEKKLTPQDLFCLIVQFLKKYKKAYVKYAYLADRFSEEQIEEFKRINLFIEDKILNIIKDCPQILTLRTDFDYGIYQPSLERDVNLGMICAFFEMGRVATEALNHQEASLQQSGTGDNVAMNCVMFGLGDIAVESLKNHQIATQQNNKGFTLGMLYAIAGDEKASLIALDDVIASRIRSSEGRTIAMYCAQREMESCVLKALEDEEQYLLQDLDGENLAMYCARAGMVKAVRFCLRDKRVLTQQNRYGENIGHVMISENSDERFNRAIKTVLDCHEASMQFDLTEMNLGMFIIEKKILELVPEVLKNKRALLNENAKGQSTLSYWYQIGELMGWPADQIWDNLSKYITFTSDEKTNSLI